MLKGAAEAEILRESPCNSIKYKPAFRGVVRSERLSETKNHTFNFFGLLFEIAEIIGHEGILVTKIF